MHEWDERKSLRRTLGETCKYYLYGAVVLCYVKTGRGNQLVVTAFFSDNWDVRQGGETMGARD